MARQVLGAPAPLLPATSSYGEKEIESRGIYVPDPGPSVLLPAAAPEERQLWEDS